jgi:multimeric flavodoxin WrbA
MKVLGLVGSPRIGSNTDMLVSAVLEGAASNGDCTSKVYLYEFDISPCLDCQACKKEPHKCAIKDGMQTLYSKLEEADAIVFGTPLYWYGPSAKMKLLVDRLRPFIASRSLMGKKAVLVIPSEEGADACKHAVGMFTLSFDYVRVHLVGKLLPKTPERAAVKNQPEMLTAAIKLGKSLRLS